jgi:hypothetical protein
MTPQLIETMETIAFPFQSADALMGLADGDDGRPRGGNSMEMREQLKGDRAAAASVSEQLAALQKMTVGQLAERYRELFGVPTRTGNGAYLRKKLAWRIQELAEGGLSPRALARIEELAPLAPVRWQSAPLTGELAVARVATPASDLRRDPRLPPAGSVLVRIHRGGEHRVTVLDDGFEYQGQRYQSLSRLARVITGTPWNGFMFFSLQRRTHAGRTEDVRR